MFLPNAEVGRLPSFRLSNHLLGCLVFHSDALITMNRAPHPCPEHFARGSATSASLSVPLDVSARISAGEPQNGQPNKSVERIAIPPLRSVMSFSIGFSVVYVAAVSVWAAFAIDIHGHGVGVIGHVNAGVNIKHITIGFCRAPTPPASVNHRSQSCT